MTKNTLSTSRRCLARAFVLCALTSAALTTGCTSVNNSLIPALDDLGFVTTPLPENERRVVRQDPDLPRTAEDIRQLGRELFINKVREQALKPQGTAGCDEVRFHRFFAAVRSRRVPWGFRKLKKELKHENSLPGFNRWSEPLPSGAPLRFRYVVAENGSCPSDQLNPSNDPDQLNPSNDPDQLNPSNDPDQLNPHAFDCGQTAQKLIDELRYSMDLVWCRLIPDAFPLGLAEPFVVQLWNFPDSLRGDTAPDQPIRLNWPMCLRDLQTCKATLAHEVFHKYQYRKLGFRKAWMLDDSNLPVTWFSEGSASWFEMVATGSVASFEKYEGFFTRPGKGLWDRSYDALLLWNMWNGGEPQNPAPAGALDGRDCCDYPYLNDSENSGVVTLLGEIRDRRGAQSGARAFASRFVNPNVVGLAVDAPQFDEVDLRQQYVRFISKLNQKTSQVELQRVKGPDESEVPWSDFQDLLRPYVVPLLTATDSPSLGWCREFVHTSRASLQPFSTHYYRFVFSKSAPADMELELEVKPLGGVVQATIVGGPVALEPCLEDQFQNLGTPWCYLKTGEPIRLRLDQLPTSPAQEVTLAIHGFGPANSYTISASLQEKLQGRPLCPIVELSSY